ncbi:autophagy-related protein 16-1 isoform X3 [Hyposmocoma kahamanoa]|uniref:autophagy-related protein 16-1 isoform X3 n=1 Tax=Hyposmocoma kahamanoa TaxID=1477025 RepID=UPI000E6D9C74|nr:autophagy-related protein 16-1 isoform X3 [Hyposmocoma kahamanoa]
MEGGEWRTNIISQLQARNKHETAAFQDIIAYQSRLFDNVNTLKNENLQLTLVNERIRFSGADSTGGGGGSNEKIQALEQKILKLQEELTSLHRRRGESAQQIINLNAKVHDLEKQLQNKDVVISENTALIASLRAEIQMYETNMAELQGLNQVLRDEHQALQIAFAAIEEKLRKAQDENRSLVERLIKYKAKDADKMNEENEHFLKSSSTAFFFNTFRLSSFGKKSDKVRKELEEAAREGNSRSSVGSGGSSADDKVLDSMPFYATTLPTKVAVRFDAHDGEVYAVKWSPTDRIVATGGADRKLKLWDVCKSSVESKGTLVGSNAGVMSVDFDSTGAYIVGASNDFASRVWTVGDQRMRHTLTGHSGKVMAAKFLGEPTKVITGSHDRTLKVGCDWSRAAFGPGGRLLSVGAADGAVYVWNTHSGRLEAILKDHSSAVTAVSWHPQSGLLASVDRGKRAIIWGDL